MKHMPGPDFPTGGIINGARGIHEAYFTGRGRIFVRAKCHVEGKEGAKQSIIVTELPYMVNKARLLERIAELVKDKKLDGITELRDESDKDGMRMVIELRRGENTDVLINNLYQHTAMQTVFGINMVALVDGQPRLLNLKELLEAFLRHRREVVTRRTIFDLRKARERAHVLEGLAIALANIDEMIELIKRSPAPAEAKIGLMGRDWAPGVVMDMLKKAGAEASRPEGLAAEFGLNKGKYRLSDAQAQAQTQPIAVVGIAPPTIAAPPTVSGAPSIAATIAVAAAPATAVMPAAGKVSATAEMSAPSAMSTTSTSAATGERHSGRAQHERGNQQYQESTVSVQHGVTLPFRSSIPDRITITSATESS